MPQIQAINNVSNGATYDAVTDPALNKNWVVVTPQVGDQPSKFRNEYGSTRIEDGKLTLLSKYNASTGVTRTTLRVTLPHVAIVNSVPTRSHFEQVDVSFATSDLSNEADRERMLAVILGVLSDTSVASVIHDSAPLY